MLHKLKKRSNRILLSPKKFNLYAAAAVAVVFGGFGAYTLLGSSAQTAGTITVVVKGRSYAGGPYNPIAGIPVQLTIYPGQSCTNTDSGGNRTLPANTNASGIATFTCNLGAGHEYSLLTRSIDGQGYRFESAEPGVIRGATGVTTFNAYMISLPPEPPQILSFSASPSTATKGGSTIISWMTNLTNSCTASGAPGWSGSKALGGTQALTNLAASATLTLTCSGAGGSVSKTASITVTNPPPTSTTPTPNTPAPSTPKPSTPTKPKTTPAPAPAVVGTNSADKAPPKKPERLGVVGDKGSVVLDWPRSAESEGVVGYLLQRSSDAIDWQDIAQNLQDTTYVDNAVEADTYYFYRIRAVDAAGNQSEAAVSEAVLAEAISIEPENEDEQATEAPAKESSGKGGIIAVVVALLLTATGGVLWWLRRRNQANQALYDYTGMSLPQQPTTVNPPTNPYRAEHTSTSLKDMVMQDYDPNDPKNKPGPPPQQQ